MSGKTQTFDAIVRSRLAGAAVGIAVAAATAFGAAPAYGDHSAGHDEVARGKIGALEARVWNCENNVAPCDRTGPQGAEGPQGPQGSQGPRGPRGLPGADGAFASLECTQGQTLISDVNGYWVCS